MSAECVRIASSCDLVRELGGKFNCSVDSIYLGGGTPSVLAPVQLQRLFRAVRDNFEVECTAEITVECAAGTISSEIIDVLLGCGVNRVSLGVQSFVDKESSSVGRLHTRTITLDDIARLRSSGIGNIGIDLIAGLPDQTEESWQLSLSETLASGVPHVSVYMLEVDEDSRLGTELLAVAADITRILFPMTISLLTCILPHASGWKKLECSSMRSPTLRGRSRTASGCATRSIT